MKSPQCGEIRAIWRALSKNLQGGGASGLDRLSDLGEAGTMAA
jgi:hypothetical protein